VVIGVAAILVGQLIVAATGALAGTVSLRPDAEFTGWAVAFDAAAGERNQLDVRDIGNPAAAPSLRSWEIRDSGAPLAAGEHCTVIDAHTAQCGSALFSPLVFGARVALGDQDDWFSVISPVPQPPSFYPLHVTAEGGAGDDRLHGGAGFDDLGGGGGRDELYGDAGNDILSDGDRDEAADERAPSADRIDGGDGDDLVSYHARKSPVSVDLADPRPDGALGENDVLTNVESSLGGRGRDRLAGNNGPNIIDGGGGADRLFGRDGNDELAFREGSISCGRGLDVVFDDVNNTRHGSLVAPRADDELGYLQPDCESFRPRGGYPSLPSLPAYPARLRPSWGGLPRVVRPRHLCQCRGMFRGGSADRDVRASPAPGQTRVSARPVDRADGRCATHASRPSSRLSPPRRTRQDHHPRPPHRFAAALDDPTPGSALRLRFAPTFAACLTHSWTTGWSTPARPGACSGLPD